MSTQTGNNKVYVENELSIINKTISFINPAKKRRIKTRCQLIDNFHQNLMELENTFTKKPTVDLVEEIILMYKVQFYI